MVCLLFVLLPVSQSSFSDELPLILHNGDKTKQGEQIVNELTERKDPDDYLERRKNLEKKIDESANLRVAINQVKQFYVKLKEDEKKLRTRMLQLGLPGIGTIHR
ncbi:uncharacterized protein LOC110009579 [Jatropha curcas]|uniref:uncharacterized protein LOC110009579 n=1 Tax=Jatropha curcas TaxID=180498 RepID=UPI0009D74CA8|nr:uncharacterized protein LOC110009579 [Jatropha curcas]